MQDSAVQAAQHNTLQSPAAHNAEHNTIHCSRQQHTMQCRFHHSAQQRSSDTAGYNTTPRPARALALLTLSHYTQPPGGKEPQPERIAAYDSLRYIIEAAAVAAPPPPLLLLCANVSP